MEYSACTELQRNLLEQVADGAPDTLLLVQHPPVLTLGANFHPENLLLTEAEYAQRGIQVVKTERGGDVTFHGPGQLVIYPIFNIANHGKDLHKWLRDLEETILVTAQRFGLEGRRFPPHTGVWINDRKLAAIGIKIRKWVSMHGIALNCDNDLATFDLIVPCGIQGYGVTSLTQELMRTVTVDEAKPAVISAFEQVFSTRP
jgi:lipoyl(octanoyl) transferase